MLYRPPAWPVWSTGLHTWPASALTCTHGLRHMTQESVNMPAQTRQLAASGLKLDKSASRLRRLVRRCRAGRWALSQSGWHGVILIWRYAAPGNAGGKGRADAGIRDAW